ncbi:39030_t:CDS:2, partial [Gigaspora margarita]
LKMLYLLVQVNEGTKCIIPEHIISIESESNQFSDLFDAITLKQYNDREVKVFVRRKKSEGWREVDNGLNGDLKMLKILGFMQVKFCLVSVINLDMPDSTQNEQGKTFINRLTSALWYIDPHLSTLYAHLYHLPALFTQLKMYQDGKSYNEFYYTSYHKKNQLSQQKLADLSNSLEISISQPWASSNRWSKVMLAILSLIEILKKYSDYLIATTTISACKPHQLKDEYTQLDDLLFEKTFYEHVDVQQYLPYDVIDQHDETLKACMLARIHDELPHYFIQKMQKNVLNKYSYIQKVIPAVLQMLHFDLTGNAAVTSNAISRNFKDRLQLMLILDETEAYFNEQ